MEKQEVAFPTKEELEQITVVVPTKNEAGSLGEVLEGVLELGYRVLVVDGHSKDKTHAVCKKAGVKFILDHKKGKGDGIRTAINYLPNEGVAVFMDADGSHNPDDIRKLVRPILDKKADLVIGSRMLGGSDELYGKFYDALKMFGSEIITLSINWRFKAELTDCQNGFRAFDLSFAKKLRLEENIHTIEQEEVIKTLHLKGRIVEVPAHEYPRLKGKSKISLRRVFWRFLWSWLKNLFIATGPKNAK